MRPTIRTAPGATGASRSPPRPTPQRKLRGAYGAAALDVAARGGRAARLQARPGAGVDTTRAHAVRGGRSCPGRVERGVRRVLREPEGARVGDRRARLREPEHRADARGL